MVNNDNYLHSQTSSFSEVPDFPFVSPPDESKYGLSAGMAVGLERLCQVYGLGLDHALARTGDLWEGIRARRWEQATKELAHMVGSCSAVLALPSSRSEVRNRQVDALRLHRPEAIDLSPFLGRNTGFRSTGQPSLAVVYAHFTGGEELRRHWNGNGRLVLFDDFFQSGRTLWACWLLARDIWGASIEVAFACPGVAGLSRTPPDFVPLGPSGRPVESAGHVLKRLGGR